MGKRGPKPKGKIKIEWTSDFAYAIGLLVTDGNLSKNGRHITFTSKDLDQIESYKLILSLDSKIGQVTRGMKIYYRIQFGDVLFYKFLIDIGLSPAKSKTLKKIIVPDKYFFDYLRGAFDGDGYVYSYWDPRWKSSFMFYLGFASAAPEYLLWLQSTIKRHIGVTGHITKAKNSSCLQLKYAKADSIKIFKKMYYSKNVVCLSRKRLKINKILGIVGELLID